MSITSDHGEILGFRWRNTQYQFCPQQRVWRTPQFTIDLRCIRGSVTHWGGCSWGRFGVDRFRNASLDVIGNIEAPSAGSGLWNDPTICGEWHG